MAKDNKFDDAPQTPAAAGGAPAQQTAPPHLDDSKALSAYSNYCRVTSTPEELILDFCLNTNPQPTPQTELVVQNRIVMNFYTAKRLLAALMMAVQRHEQAFGVLETDVAKRVRGGTAPPRPTN